MKLKWLGTATILLEQDGTQLLFDPFIPLNKKSYKPPLDEIATIPNIFVTHGHFDHIAHIPGILRRGDGKTAVYCTAKPREALISKGVGWNRIREIKPGDVVRIVPFEARVLKGKHIDFDSLLIVSKIFNPRLLSIDAWRNMRFMLQQNKVCAEAGETVVYDISAADKRILLLGSMNLDDRTEYPTGADLLIMPFQGRSNIEKYAMQFIEKLQPKKVLLDHFDDSFPPISSEVDPGRFISLMRLKHPDVPVIRPRAGADWIEI